jgi:hypothetical protein
MESDLSNLILNAFAYLPDFRGSQNMIAASSEKHVARYLRLAAVSLISAKERNPECSVALVINIDVPREFSTLFSKWDIEVIQCPFENFIFQASARWSLAFYKLQALDYVVQTREFDNILLLDTDTYVAASLDSFWPECLDHVMLFNIQHSLDIPQARQMNVEYEQLFSESTSLTNYGGEFVGGSRVNLQTFMEVCSAIYQRMLAEHVVSDHGDEFILSSAAAKVPDLIKDAGAYVYRYWTQRFYLVSTNYQNNPVCVWHLPDEKALALSRAYDYLKQNGRLPNSIRMQKWCNFRPARRPFNLYNRWSPLKGRASGYFKDLLLKIDH